MSGAEVIAVIGLISSTISIIESSRDLFDAATNAKGLHEAFRATSQNIPLVLNTLRDCRRIQEQADREYRVSTDLDHKRELEESAIAVQPIIAACKENAQKLKEIFDKAVPGDQATWLERYTKAAHTAMPGKKKRVEELMKEILEKLQLLHSNRFFQVEAERRREDLCTAVQQLSELSPSLPDEEGRYAESGSGAIYINAGTGTQRNYNLSGGTNNRQYNAETQHFGKD